MYAVVRTGGKQYRVASGDVVTVEKLDGAAAGDAVELDDVLALDVGEGLTLGTPVVEGARVVATVLEQKKNDKIVVFKKKRRKNYRRTRGHRQQVTVLRVTDILDKRRKAAEAESGDADETVRSASEAPEAAAAEAPPPGDASKAEAGSAAAAEAPAAGEAVEAEAAADDAGKAAEDGGSGAATSDPETGRSTRTDAEE